MATEKYKFGIVTTPAHTEWLVQSASVTGSAQEAMALGTDGNPVCVHYYQVQDERAMEVIIPAEESFIPEIGQVVKYGNEAYYVSSVSKTETNTDFIRFSISMKRFPHSGEDGTGLPLLADASESI